MRTVNLFSFFAGEAVIAKGLQSSAVGVAAPHSSMRSPSKAPITSGPHDPASLAA